MKENADLARFQEALVDVLRQELPPEVALSRLKSDPAFAPFRSYIDTFDVRMVGAASELVRKWSTDRESSSR